MASAMKLRQIGVVKKPLFVVPKSLVAQWGDEFRKFFPAAKIMTLGESDFTPAHRKEYANRIATGDFDAVIISYEQFKKIPMSEAEVTRFYQDQIRELQAAIDAEVDQGRRKAPSVKAMEKKKAQLLARLQKRIGQIEKDVDNIDFEALGVDSLFVDEAHSYKNLPILPACPVSAAWGTRKAVRWPTTSI